MGIFVLFIDAHFSEGFLTFNWLKYWIKTKAVMAFPSWLSGYLTHNFSLKAYWSIQFSGEKRHNRPEPRFSVYAFLHKLQ